MLGFISASIIGFCLLIIVVARITHKIRNKKKLKKRMKKYFGTSLFLDDTSDIYNASTRSTLVLTPTTQENQYEYLSARSRSPTDSLPPLLDPSVTEDDVPGYMKLKNYKIFKPEKETYLTMK